MPIADTLYNKRLRRGWGVVEIAFDILKQSFCELLTKSDLDIAFLSNVITCCCILHNIMLGQSHEDVDLLHDILRIKGLEEEVRDEE